MAPAARVRVSTPLSVPLPAPTTAELHAALLAAPTRPVQALHARLSEDLATGDFAARLRALVAHLVARHDATAEPDPAMPAGERQRAAREAVARAVLEVLRGGDGVPEEARRRAVALVRENLDMLVDVVDEQGHVLEE